MSRKFCLWLGAMVMALALPGTLAWGQPYELKPGDVVEVTVLEDSNLNRRVLVGPDGNISLPLAGTLEAGGRSLNRVQAAIAARLRGQFVNPPTVTVSLVALGPADGDLGSPGTGEGDDPSVGTVWVLGEVSRPGRYGYETDKPITVLQALALAGGPGVFAARSRIQVRSRTPAETDAAKPDAAAPAKDGAEAEVDPVAAAKAASAALEATVEELRLFDYTALEDGGPNSTPFVIRDGDVIVVPERGLFE